MKFAEAWEQFQSIQYGFTRDEAHTLWSFAEKATGPLVEVGSMQGGSACIMEATEHDVTCIDPIENPVYYGMFLNNATGKRITHIRKKDCDVWPEWKSEPISLLLIDHDHSYQSTLDSLLNWKGHLAPDSVVLVHDFGGSDWPEVEPATVASGIHIKGTVGRLAVCNW